MIIGDSFVFIHNPHTAGAFLRTAFKKMFPEANFFELTRWHQPIQKLSKRHWNKMKFGVIRNPWEWYVSFYKHQQPNGPLLRFFLNGKENTFNNFLIQLLSKEFALDNKNKLFHPVGNPYVAPSISKLEYISNLDIGFFTYRYIYMFFDNYEDIFYKKTQFNLSNHDKLISLDEVCKQENLVKDIINIFKKHNMFLNEKRQKNLMETKKENFTNHKPYKEYYSQDLVKLVENKDNLIIQKYNYKF